MTHDRPSLTNHCAIVASFDFLCDDKPSESLKIVTEMLGEALKGV